MVHIGDLLENTKKPDGSVEIFGDIADRLQHHCRNQGITNVATKLPW